MNDMNTPLDPMAEENEAVEETPVVEAPVADDDAELDAEVTEGDEAEETEAPAEAEEVKSDEEAI